MPTKKTKSKKGLKNNLVAQGDSRKLKIPQYKTLKLSKRIKHPGAKLPSSFKLFRLSVMHLLRYKRVFFMITLVYLILTIFLVKGLGFTTNIAELKEVLSSLFTGTKETLTVSFSLFGLLVGSAGSASSDVAGVYQSILLIIISLALIWALRQTYAKEKVSALDAFYKGIYPLIPFFTVLLIIGLQIVPLIIGNWFYGIVVGSGIAVDVGEKLAWGTGFFMLAMLSFYMISSSVFALYIVTLPDMRPLQALRSARDLVRHRRWSVSRKILFLPAALLFTAAIIIIPMIVFIPKATEWTFFILSMMAIAATHSYMYTLYRKLL